MEFRQRPKSQAKAKPDTRTRSPLTRSGRQADRNKPRHAGLFEAVRRLDAVVDPAERKALADWIRGEYEREYEFTDVPLGFVSVCYLGPPYVEHRLDLAASIVDHFSVAQAMPEPFQQARMMIRSGGYEFLEVYLSGKVIAVRPDGTPVHSEPQEQP